jgi:hypothetical protein
MPVCLCVCLSVRTVFSAVFPMKKRVEKVTEEISAAWWWAFKSLAHANV